jgi:hypothetical protein
MRALGHLWLDSNEIVWAVKNASDSDRLLCSVVSVVFCMTDKLS